MKNPYDILGISSSASIDEIKSAYKKLSAQIHTNFSPQEAESKMIEINEAYDLIVLSRFENDSVNTDKSTTNNNISSDFNLIKEKINNKKFDDAEIQLDNISSSKRTAEWYYLKGVINHNRGWFEEAKENFTIACQMDPANAEYQNAFNAISASSSSNGGFRSSKRQSHSETSGTSCCTLCNALICADCCCDCFCDDFIRCC